jgi:hypothetical protein
MRGEKNLKLAVRHLLILHFIRANHCTLTELYTHFTQLPADQRKEWDLATTYSRFSKDLSHLKRERLVHQGSPGIFNRRPLALTPLGIRYLQSLQSYLGTLSTVPKILENSRLSSPHSTSSEPDEDWMDIFSDYLGEEFATQYRTELSQWMKMLINRKNRGDLEGLVHELLDVLPLTQKHKVAISADLEKICQFLITKHQR